MSTNTSPNLNKLQTAWHCSKFSPLHQSKQASEDVCLWHDAYAHPKPSVWICHPSESGVPAPRCRSSPPGCASSPRFSSWSFPALNASWLGWKPALYFSDPSGSENQREKMRGDACNIKAHLDLWLILYYFWAVHSLRTELTGLTPILSSFTTRACSISGRTSFLMLLLFFWTAGFAVCFFFGAGAGLYSVGFFSAKLLDSVNTNISEE